MTNLNTPSKNTAAFFLQAAIAFGVSRSPQTDRLG
jgi:hypothetical protein